MHHRRLATTFPLLFAFALPASAQMTMSSSRITCTESVVDQATGACIDASSIPGIGQLLPLGTNFYVDAASGNVGIGTVNPVEYLQIGEYFTTTRNAFIELRTAGGGLTYKQGLKMRSSNPFFGFDIEHDDFEKGLNILRHDVDFGAFGASALFIDRQTGHVGLETTEPNVALQLGTNSTPGDRHLAIRTAGGNSYKAGIRLSHFEDGNGFIIESDERGSVDGLNVIRETGGVSESSLYINRVSGQIGIGTTAPTDLLHLRTAGPAILRLEADTDNSNETDHAGIEFSQDNGLETGYVGFNEGANEFQVQSATNDIDFDTGGALRMRVTLGGNVGIGTGSPSQLLSVNGSAGKPGGGSWSNFSDERLKKNIADLEGALDTLLALRGVTFEYKDPASIHELEGERIGFIAQEVERVLPDWVEESGEYKMLTIRGFEALAVEALRELTARNAELEARVARLESVESELASLRAAVAALAGR